MLKTDGLETLTIDAFIEKYKIGYTREGIAYHMKIGNIDWQQPGRDKFVIVSDKTLAFYGL